jgi:hypothetical protein
MNPPSADLAGEIATSVTGRSAGTAREISHAPPTIPTENSTLAYFLAPHTPGFAAL